MTGDRSRDGALPEALTRFLAAPESVIRSTPGERTRSRQPSQPRRAVTGVWVWALTFNVVGFAILAALWRSMG